MAIIPFGCTENAKGDIKPAVNSELSFTSSDQTLEASFNWARAEALGYVGNSSSPVGPWYEAALPGREAFCMRDLAHQCIGAEILGLDAQNLNMFLKFAENISESKDWCSYWEINRYNLPAPADYKNDEEFWYNLPSSFDIISRCWRLYCWTGNDEYIKNDIFLNFYEKSLNNYIYRWKLQPNMIMDRPMHMNLPEPFDKNKEYYHICCRGLPSYVETSSFPIACSADLIASLYSAFHSYSEILSSKGEIEKSKIYEDKAIQYMDLLETKWWNESEKTYQTFWSEEGEFFKGQGELFLLWFDVLNQPERIKATFDNMLAYGLNIESLSYLPVLYSKYGYYQNAYDLINKLSDPSEKRRSYPEVSYAVVDGIVSGLMGVDVNAPQNRITTCPRFPMDQQSEVRNLKILGSNVNITHIDNTSSVFENNGSKAVLWKAEFPGQHEKIYVDGVEKDAKPDTDKLGNPYSYIEVPIKEGSSSKVGVKAS